MFSTLSTGPSVRFLPPSQNMKAIPPPPPQQKLSISFFENEAAAPSLSQHPGTHWFIVINLRLATGRSNQSHPPVCNLMALKPPASHNYEKNNEHYKTQPTHHPLCDLALIVACLRSTSGLTHWNGPPSHQLVIPSPPPSVKYSL